MTSQISKFPTVVKKVVAHFIECSLRFREVFQVHRFKVWVQFPHRNPNRPQGAGNRDEISLGGNQGLGNLGYRVLQRLVVHDFFYSCMTPL